MTRSHGQSRRRFLQAGAAASAALGARSLRAQGLHKLTAIYPTRSGASWPMYLAKEGGYYEKHGLDVSLRFGVHPVGIAGLVSGEVHFTNYSLDDVAAAVVRDPILVVMASMLNRASFALMARSDIANVEALKGKRIGIGRVGDPPYHYTSALLKGYGLKPTDIQWVPTGADANARATMLIGGQIDAVLLTAPAWYRLEEHGLKPLTLIEDHENIVISTGYTFKKSWVAANPDLPERIIRAQAEAVQGFYADKAAAVAAYRKYDPAISETDAARVYDSYKAKNLLDRIPLLPLAAAAATVERIGGDIAAVKAFDFQQAIDMRVVRRLVAEGFFEKLHGPGIKAEQERKLKDAFT